MSKCVSLRELKQMAAAEGIHGARDKLLEGIRADHFRGADWSVRDLFESLHEDGAELLRSISYRRSGGRPLREAADAVDTSAFSSIIGQIVFNKIKEAYQDPELLWPQLCDTMTTEFLDGERIPGVGRLGTKLEEVDEGMPYPLVGLNEEYIDTAPTRKRGCVVPLTREIIVADRTGILLKTAGEEAYWMGLDKEQRVLAAVCGVVNNYKRNGTATNTYLTSGSYVNSTTGNALDASANEWRALEKLDLLFDGITDPNTGVPIIVKPDVLLVPSALKKTALRIMNATQVEHVNNVTQAQGTAAPSIRTFSPNPVVSAKVLSSPMVKFISGSTTKYWYGAPKKAFLYIEVWGIETTQAPAGHPDEFNRDIWAQYKVSERGVTQVYEPRFMTQSDQ